MHILTSLSILKLNSVSIFCHLSFEKINDPIPFILLTQKQYQGTEKELHDTLTFVAVLQLRGDIIQSCALRYFKKVPQPVWSLGSLHSDQNL